MFLVTLYCATQVWLRCSTNTPQFRRFQPWNQEILKKLTLLNSCCTRHRHNGSSQPRDASRSVRPHGQPGLGVREGDGDRGLSDEGHHLAAAEYRSGQASQGRPGRRKELVLAGWTDGRSVRNLLVEFTFLSARLTVLPSAIPFVRLSVFPSVRHPSPAHLSLRLLISIFVCLWNSTSMCFSACLFTLL
jgi:hypothetical protein